MYISITDPGTGCRLYADLMIQVRTHNHWGELSSTIEIIEVHDVVTEQNLIEGILHELRTVAFSDHDHFMKVLREATGVMCDSCPELVAEIWEQLGNGPALGVL